MSDLELESRLRAQREQAKSDIIDSSRDDAPPPGGKEQLLAALNLPITAEANRRSARFRALEGRSATIVGLALVVGASAAFVASSRTERADVGQAPASVEAAPAAAPTDEGEHAPIAIATPEPQNVPEPTPPSSVEMTSEPTQRPGAVTSSARAAPLAKARSESTLGREVARMTAARSALAAGDTARTLELLDSYESEFPLGAFSVEVAVLRVESLARSGRMEEARRLGERFLQQHPHGLPASRVASTLGIARDPQSGRAPAPIP